MTNIIIVMSALRVMINILVTSTADSQAEGMPHMFENNGTKLEFDELR
jgi:hypothetical protein